CTECRTRKVKCSKERPSCAQCRHHRIQCIYESKTNRTPLTRAHLTSVEERLTRFETALHRLFPAGNVERIVLSLAQDQNSQLAEIGMPITTPGQTVLPLLPSPPESNQEQVPLTLPGFDDLPCNGQTGSDIQVGWDRFPQTPDMPDENSLVDAFFNNYHPGQPFIHEATFRAEHDRRLSNTPSLAWQILSKSVMAIGAWTLESTDIDLQLYNQAKGLLETIPLMEPGSLTLVQSLMLLHEFAQKRGMQDMSLQYLSVAARMAINIGLHRESGNSTFSLFEREIRNRVWWSLYIFDSCSAKSFGLPLLLPENNFINTSSVMNIHDETLDPTTTSLPPEVNGPTLYSGLISQAKFHLLANSIYRRLIATPCISIAEVQKLEASIDDLRDSCPSYLKGSGSVLESNWLRFAKDRLRICDKNLRILIWRPYLSLWTSRVQSIHDENDVYRESAFRCLHATKGLLALVVDSIRNQRYTRLSASFLLYCLFHATLIYVVFLKAGSSLPESASFVQDIRLIKRVVSQSWIGNDAQVTHFLNVINRLCAPFDTPTALVINQDINSQAESRHPEADTVIPNDPSADSMMTDLLTFDWSSDQ
ncbi:hypothetical protein ASPWEDRAFT_112273, partial [Aspergillus wentii DTO 134E9]